MIETTESDERVRQVRAAERRRAAAIIERLTRENEAKGGRLNAQIDWENRTLLLVNGILARLGEEALQMVEITAGNFSRARIEAKTAIAHKIADVKAAVGDLISGDPNKIRKGIDTLRRLVS